MARTDLTPVTGVSTNPAAGVTATFTAADTSNQNQFTHTGKELIIAYNSGAGSHTVTVTSAPDSLGRTKDVAAESIAAGAYKVFGVPQIDGWRQTNAKFYLEANHAEVKFLIIRLP